MPPTGDALRQTIGNRYFVERALGRGGSAAVYLARDSIVGREVAIKVLHPEIAYGIGTDRFLREIRLTGRLQHPNIVAIHDSGVWEGLPYFVMPFMEGGSLRDRLMNESQLPLADVVAITRQIADALACAHEAGVVHRDVKPENILFSAGRALVSDFGIAHAMAWVMSGSGTTPGVVRGTPAYMSPEQASGDVVDGRSDIYSLACVAYEMIAGIGPFVGPNARVVMAQRITRDPLDIDRYRAVPPATKAVLSRAMATSPGDRESDARAFARDLAASVESEASAAPSLSTARRTVIGVASIAAVLLLAALVWSRSDVRSSNNEMALDSLGVAVAVVASPTERGSSTNRDATKFTAALGRAMSAWSDVRVEAIDSAIGRSLDATNLSALRAARAARARWAVVVRIEGASPNVSLSASLFDAVSASEARRVNAAVTVDSLGNPSAYLPIVVRLFGGAAEDVPRSGAGAETSFASWLLYLRGKTALRRWQLDSAAQFLEASIQRGQAPAPAFVGAGQVSVWRSEDLAPSVRGEIIRSLESAALAPRDSILGRAVVAMSAADYPRACVEYDALRRLDSLDAVAWAGLGDCHTRDHVVIRDARSPTGYRFRSSYQAGINGYLRAAALDPPSAALVAPSARIGPLFTSTNRFIIGASLGPGSSRFGAFPKLDPRGDTVMLVPYPLNSILSGVGGPDRDEQFQAIDRLVERHRAVLLHLTKAWVKSSGSADARESLASALELRGEISPEGSDTSSAIAALAGARRLTRDSKQQLRLAASDVRLRIKLADFVGARRVADSVIRAADRNPRRLDPDESRVLSSLAALIGRDESTRRWLMSAGTPDGSLSVPDSTIPLQVRREVIAVFTSAALGHCDSVAATLARAEAAFDRFVTPARREAAWLATMPRPLSLAARCDGGRALMRVKNPADGLMRIQQRFAQGDYGAVRLQLDSLERARRAARPGDISLDYVLQEAWLRVQIGDTAKAIRRLGETLEALPTVRPDLWQQMPQAAALCGILDLAARLEARADATAARKWSSQRDDLCTAH